MNNYCVDLNISIPFFTDENYIRLLTSLWRRHQEIDYSKINIDIINYFKSKNLRIVLAESFFRRPNDPSRSAVHKDASNYTDATKINWVYGGGDSVMNWYQPINDHVRTNISDIGVEYEYYDYNDLELVHSQQVGFPSIVQVGLPHNISNVTSDRLCISVIIKEIDSNYYIPFERAKEIFQFESLASCTGIEPVSAT